MLDILDYFQSDTGSEIERKLTVASEEKDERRERVATFWSRKGEGLGGGE